MIEAWPASEGCSVMAHRGGALLGPANRLETIARAIASGADAVEVDVRVLGDGEVVLFHDSTVSIRGRLEAVAELGRQQIEEELGRLTTLEDLLALAGGHHFGIYLDIKHLGGVSLAELVDAVVSAELAERTVIGSFDRGLVAEVVADARVRGSLLYHDTDADPLVLATELGCSLVHPCFDRLPHLVSQMAGPWMQRLHKAGLGVIGWNSNDSVLLKQMRAAGFDVLCTDDPAAARSS